MAIAPDVLTDAALGHIYMKASAPTLVEGALGLVKGLLAGNIRDKVVAVVNAVGLGIATRKADEIREECQETVRAIMGRDVTDFAKALEAELTQRAAAEDMAMAVTEAADAWDDTAFDENPDLDACVQEMMGRAAKAIDRAITVGVSPALVRNAVLTLLSCQFHDARSEWPADDAYQAWADCPA